MNTNTLTPTKTESNHNESMKSTSQKNPDSVNPNKNHKISKKEPLCYEYDKSNHIKFNCLIVKTE